MQTKAVTVKNPYGVHMRVAGLIVELSRKYECELWLSMDGMEAVPGNSILSVLTLGAVPGSQLTIRAEGGKENDALERVAEVLSDGAGI
jgi:phosphocarrier protein